MAKTSAGILPFRRRGESIEVLLVHPGGPFWANRDLGSWSISKGEYGPDEDALHAALREVHEETGFEPTGPFIPLTRLRQPSGKLVDAWAVEADWDPSRLTSNTFRLEWPRGSGREQEYPEVDRAAWFDCREARRHILPGQRGFIEELARIVAAAPHPPRTHEP